MDKQKDSLYLPYRMIIEKITDEAPGVRTFRLKFKEEREGEDFHFKAGQFGEYSAFGEGESTFCIASSPTRIYRMYFPTSRKSDNRLIQIGNGRHNRFSRTIRQYVSFG